MMYSMDKVVHKQVLPFSDHAPFHQNNRAETEEELANVVSGLATMDDLMKTSTLACGVVRPLIHLIPDWRKMVSCSE